MARGLLACLALALLPRPAPALEASDLAFMPPAVAPEEVCLRAGTAEDDEARGDEDDDAIMLRFLRRDLRALSDDDADGSFPFILDLLAWQAELDPEFTDTRRQLAAIALHVDAGRLDALRASGLIEGLRAQAATLDGAEKMALAGYYMTGVGVDADPGFARALIRDAAYGGNVEALLAAARMAADGDPLPGWDAPLDLTLTLAFGGILGAVDAGVCQRAERIARMYLDGDIVRRDPQVALAWYRFSADMGGTGAAWRVVEFQLSAPPGLRDDAEMLRYLEVAAARGFVPSDEQREALNGANGLDAERVRAILGPNVAAEENGRPSVAPLLRLDVNPDADEVDPDGPRLRYLRRLAAFDTAPGWVFTRLAEEILIRRGRWAGEAEAMEALEEAYRRGDPEGTRTLARMLVRYRDDPATLNRAVNLLTEAAERGGLAGALDDLDGLYRCQAPDAPRLVEADAWAAAFSATQSDDPDISIEDAVPLDPAEDPWIVAQIQSQALDGRPQALARMLERVQLDPLATGDGQRTWARRAEASEKALELFAIFEFQLATTPRQRDLAVELFRRVYLNNGVTTALDLSVALVDQGSRDPAIADEVARLLTTAGRRGEGASIRLLARLQARERPEAAVYAEFADTIEERGDFLALMFAIPYVGRDRAEDYVDRAVSLMACGTKDADELGDAATIMGDPEGSAHWRAVGLHFEGGHVLSRLELANRQVSAHGTGAAPGAAAALEEALAGGDGSAREGLWRLYADPGQPGYDPEAAARQLLDGLKDGAPWALDALRRSSPEVRERAEAGADLRPVLEGAAAQGDADAALALGLMLRDRAAGPGDLADATDWLRRAAENGSVPAMAELGRMLAAGLGGDREEAAQWLDRAGRGGDREAADMARLLRIAP